MEDIQSHMERRNAAKVAVKEALDKEWTPLREAISLELSDEELLRCARSVTQMLFSGASDSFIAYSLGEYEHEKLGAMMSQHSDRVLIAKSLRALDLWS